MFFIQKNLGLVGLGSSLIRYGSVNSSFSIFFRIFCLIFLVLLCAIYCFDGENEREDKDKKKKQKREQKENGFLFCFLVSVRKRKEENELLFLGLLSFSMPLSAFKKWIERKKIWKMYLSYNSRCLLLFLLQFLTKVEKMILP